MVDNGGANVFVICHDPLLAVVFYRLSTRINSFDSTADDDSIWVIIIC